MTQDRRDGDNPARWGLAPRRSMPDRRQIPAPARSCRPSTPPRPTPASPGVHEVRVSRTHNPTRFAYERCVAGGGSRGFAFASGMAATATLLELLDGGDHIIAMDDL